MAFDFKKEFKEYYNPGKKPGIITVPEFNYMAVRGKGNPNEENSEYKASLELLYPLIYTIKMSKKADVQPEGYFDFVVPPLEGLWWTTDNDTFEYKNKDDLNFISMIRLPDFVTRDIFEWAKEEATKKKNNDFSKVEYFTYDEGLCVQAMHVGSYDEEDKTIKKLTKHIEEEGYIYDLTSQRLHHELYLSNPRRCKEENLKTIIRLPIKPKE